MTLPIEADQDIFTPRLPPSPYPGLRPFQKAEWPIFFGRERMTEDVIRLLLKKRLLLVHGVSGNGKSSLIKAGVLPRLEQEHARSEILWRTCESNPGKDPLGNLSEALASISMPHQLTPIDFRRALNRGKPSAKAISELLDISDRNRVCILIDQFEEIFHQHGDSEKDRASLLSEFLVGFKESPPEGMFVLLTMRSDFLGLCSQFVDLAEVVNEAQYLLPRMGTDNLLRAIREPANLFGGSVTQQLAERLIVDAQLSQDELPLIQHGLAQLWGSAAINRNKDGPILGLDDYRSAGSLASMISAHADEVAGTAADDEEGKKLIEELFRALTEIDSEGRAVRRPQQFGQLVAVTGATQERLRLVLEAFRRPGVSFVTPFFPKAIELETEIDVSHEALIRNWKRISDRPDGWLHKEFRDGNTWRALRVWAEIFATNPAHLLAEATTEARSDWIRGRTEAWALRYGNKWSEVQRLLEASRNEIYRKRREVGAQREEAQRLRVQVERNARMRYYMFVAAASSVIMGALLIYAIVAKNRAEIDRQKAELEQSISSNAEKYAEEKTTAAQAALQQAIDAANRASKFQSESAKSYVLSHGGNQQTFSQTLTFLKNETDPLKIAFFGQILSQLLSFAKEDDIHAAIEILMRDFNQTQDTSSEDAIVQALSAVGANLTTSQAQQEVTKLLQGVPEGLTARQIQSLALVFDALIPKVEPGIASQMRSYLIKLLATTHDPEAMSAVSVALIKLNWTPSIDEFERLLGGVLKTLSLTTDPVQLEKISAVLLAMAPQLSLQSAQHALESIKSMPLQAELLKPVIDALSARLPQTPSPSASSTPAPDTPPTTSSPVPTIAPKLLFQRIAGSRWCTSSRSYTLQFYGNTVVWRDNLGSIDVETVSSNGPTDAQTITQKSLHQDGKGEDPGTTWSYHLIGSDKINVKSSNGKAPFSLSRC